MESIITDEIIVHLQKNELIKPSQHGFWKSRSCLTNLLVYLGSVVFNTGLYDASSAVV